MPRLFFGNFDFEHCLGDHPHHQLSEKLLRINAGLTTSLLPLMSPGDYLWIPQLLQESTDDQLSQWKNLVQQAGVLGVSQVHQVPENEEVEFVPWGWTTPLIQWAKKQGWEVQLPEMNVVTWANSRATSFAYEQQWESAPPGAAEVKQAEDLTRLLAEIEDDAQWVIKANFSMSARERMIGQGRNIPEATLNWLNKRLRNGIRIFFEPWLGAISEMSFHYEISSYGNVEFLGMTELLTDDFGRYLGNRLVEKSAESDWSYSKSQTKQLAVEYTENGYFGPLSIDAMRYRLHDGTCKERPLQDINARYSMGRCELERTL